MERNLNLVRLSDLSDANTPPFGKARLKLYFVAYIVIVKALAKLSSSR